MAIAANSAARPGELMLALRGSGQALYVGLADDAFVIASEPYGVIEETASYVRMDGETPSDPTNANATRGQIVRLDASAAGRLAGDGHAGWVTAEGGDVVAHPPRPCAASCSSARAAATTCASPVPRCPRVYAPP